MLSISDLHVCVGGMPILDGLLLEVPAGEMHVVMGPNGAGKSALSYTLAGRAGQYGRSDCGRWRRWNREEGVR